MILICGLGNIGSEYINTRHNIGFIFIDYLLQKLAITENSLKEKHQSLLVQDSLHQHNVIFAKPQNFMNNSGVAVHSIARFYKIPAQNIIIIHDELDLSFGDVRTKFAGGHAGHNGLRSIDQHIGNQYHRIRIGIDHPRNSENPFMPVSNYVLGNFTAEQQLQLSDIFQKSAKLLENIMHNL